MPQHLQNLDYVAIGIYVLLMAFIGLSFGWFVKDIGSYFKGGGAIPWTMSAISNFMAWFSTFVFVAYGGIAYTHGLVAVTVYWATVPACIVGAFIFARRWRRTGLTTPTEYLEARYNLGLQQVVTWIGLIMRFLDNMIRLYAIGLFITESTPLSLEQAILASGIIVTVFNIIGGVWSVVVMSTVQFFILMLACIIMVPLALGEVGGIATLFGKIPRHMTWFNGPKGQWLWLLVFYFMIFIKVNENWTFIQRYYCVRDEKEAVRVGLLTGVLFLVSMPIFLLPAIAAHLIVPNLADPEKAYVALSLKLLPAGIMGILFCSMFAATMSSLNSDYNVMAGVFTNDVYKRLIHPGASDKRLLWVGRISTALVGLIMIGGAMYIKYFGGAFEANKLFTGILAIPLGVPLLLGILVKRPDATSSNLTIIVGVIAGIVLNATKGVSWEMATLVETVLCLLIYFYPVLRGVRCTATPRVEILFQRLNTPIAEEDKPVITSQTRRSLSRLFVFSLVISGGLFIGMSMPSRHLFSGQLSIGAGIICLLGAAVLWIRGNRGRSKPGYEVIIPESRERVS